MERAVNPCGWLSTAGLLCAAAGAGDSVPSGAMADYLVHCDEWAPTDSVAACAALADRLEAAEDPSPDERLALLLVRRESLTRAEGCGGLEAISADHPDYAEVLYYQSLYDCVAEDESVALLKRAAEIEPGNYLVLQWLVWDAEGLRPEGPRIPGTYPPDADPATLAAWREAMYEAGKARAAWWQAAMADAEPDDPPAEDYLQATVWAGPLRAARSIYAAAMRAGDLGAAEAVRARLRRDMGLDALDYGTESARTSLAVACQPVLYSYLGLEDACLSGVEKLAERADDDGLPLPGYVLKAVDQATYYLRRQACAAHQGARSGYGGLVVSPGECWPELTETHAVARLRAVLERHGTPRSSEHHRVHAQGFLGGDNRLEGLRAALRADPGNAQARCDLATALDARGDSAGVAALGDVDPECLDRADFAWGDIGSLRTGAESTD